MKIHEVHRRSNAGGLNRAGQRSTSRLFLSLWPCHALPNFPHKKVEELLNAKSTQSTLSIKVNKTYSGMWVGFCQDDMRGGPDYTIFKTLAHNYHTTQSLPTNEASWRCTG